MKLNQLIERYRAFNDALEAKQKMRDHGPELRLTHQLALQKYHNDLRELRGKHNQV